MSLSEQLRSSACSCVKCLAREAGIITGSPFISVPPAVKDRNIKVVRAGFFASAHKH